SGWTAPERSRRNSRRAGVGCYHPGAQRIKGQLFALAQAGSLASEIAQVVKLGAADAARAHQVNMIDNRRVYRENTLHAVAETDFSHCDGLAHASVLARNHRSFKGLKTFFFAFADSYMHSNGIARAKLRMRRGA